MDEEMALAGSGAELAAELLEKRQDTPLAATSSVGLARSRRRLWRLSRTRSSRIGRSLEQFCRRLLQLPMPRLLPPGP